MKKLFTLLSVAVCLNTNAQVCFNAASNFAAGTNPYSITSADFNGDGIIDLAVANGNSNDISVLLGTGIGNFGAATNFAAGAFPYSITSADFNEDGIADLVVVNAGSNNVSVLLGAGTGNFGAATNFGVGTNPNSVTIGDFNMDGTVDLAIVNNSSNDVSVLLGTGTGNFGAATNFSVGSGPRSVTAADFNLDGKVDLAVANQSSQNVSILLGTGTGSFGAASDFNIGNSLLSLISADFNGDGKMDLALAGDANDVSVLLGNGAGSFGAPNNFAVGNNPQSITSADFNGDGKTDLATANLTSGGSVSVLLGTGTGGFGIAVDFVIGPMVYVITADFDGDGKADLAAANYNSTNVSVLLNCATFCSGNFGAATNFTVGTAPYSVISADFNSDGKTDLVLANASSDNVSVLLGTGTGSFGAAANFSTGTTPVSVASADFDGDGNGDLAVANSYSSNVSVLLGSGTGSFGLAASFAVGSFPSFVSCADFNRDGKTDLVVVNAGSNNVSVLLGTGTGSFGAVTNFATGTNPHSVKCTDFNGDGKVDLAVANWASNNVSVLLGTGSGTFNTAVNFPVGSTPNSLTSGDFNRDGKADLAVPNINSANVSILLGTGTGSFSTPSNFATGNNPRSVTSADFNGDGITDLAVANADLNNVSVLFGTGSGSFGAASNFATGLDPQSVISADFNGDGKVDLAVANAGSNDASVLLINTPDAPTGSTAQSFCSGYSPVVGDLTATGTAIKWYAASSGGTALAVGTALVNNTHYYASQTISGCGGESSARLDVTATVNTTPVAPTGTASQSFCTETSPTVADLSATGTSIQWYAASSGGTALATSAALGTGNYYASQTVTGCESTSRFDVTVTVNTTPGAPSGTATQSFCSGVSPTVADLSATGTSVQWYAASSGGSALATTTALVTATDYYASQTVNGCEGSLRFDVTATVNLTPGVPTGTASQSFCSGTSPTVADLAATGTSVQWYAASSGGLALATTTALVTATDYYASQTVNGCEGSLRFDVTATVNLTPGVPTGTASQSFCSGTSPTVADLAATGTSVQWYAASSGGLALATTTALVTATHYFASQTEIGCESSLRFDVTATVNITPGAPAGTASQSFCSDALPTVADLAATGTSVQWYAASSGGSALATTTALVTAAHYFASQTEIGCESSLRFDVTATVNITPGAPAGTASQSFCSDALPTVADLAATGTSVQWYAASSGGSALATTTALVTATDYYASQTVTGCESSLRFDVTATVNLTPGVPTGTASQSFCSDALPTVADLAATGTSVQWYAASSGGSALATTTALVTATHYFASQTEIGCESSLRFDVTATVNINPTVTASATVSTLCAGDSTILSGGGASSYSWSGGIIDGVSFTPLSTTTCTVTGTDVNSCSNSAVQTITVNALPNVTTSMSGVTLTAIQNGAAYQWINCDNENAPLSGQFNQNFTATTNGNYAVSVTKNGCTDTSVCSNINTIGIIENILVAEINIYPNPFTSKTLISFSEEQRNTSIKIIDVLGKIVRTINFNGKELTIEKEEMKAGVYFIQITDSNENVVNKKIMLH